MPWQSPWSEARTRAWSCSTNSMPTTGSPVTTASTRSVDTCWRWPVSAQRRATATWRLPGRRPASRSSATSTPRPPVSLTTSDVRSEPVAATSLVRRPEGVPTTGGAADPRRLFPIEGDSAFSGAMIAQAHLLSWAESYDDAVELLASTAAGLARAGQPQLQWEGVRWLEDEQLPARLDPDRFTPMFVRLALALADPTPKGQRPPFTTFLRLARGMVAAHADHPQVLISASMLARRLGATAEALAWSSRAEELAPSFASALTLGFAHLHLDQLDEAIGAWRKAMARDPSNLELPVQLAWELAACDRLEDALVFVDRVLAVDPSHNAASMAAQAFRYHRDKDIQHLLVIADRVRESPGDLDASNALAGICRGIPWFGVVPEPTEAIINVLKRALAELEPDSEIASLTLSALEAPSAVLTLR